MGVVRHDPRARFGTIAPAGFHILGAFDLAAAQAPHDIWITAGTNDHQLPDPHARGEAYDLRTKDLDPIEIVNLYLNLKTILGGAFTVLYELPEDVEPRHPMLLPIVYRGQKATGEHIHTQPRKGTTWPPAANPPNTKTV